MEYRVKEFNNIEEAKEYNKELVERLLDYADSYDSDWQEDMIYLYPTLEDFAKYEVFEGWYASVNLDKVKNAPYLSNFINFKALGEELRRTWDGTMNYYDEETGIVIATPYGW